jgi:hypothetical protein
MGGLLKGCTSSKIQVLSKLALVFFQRTVFFFFGQSSFDRYFSSLLAISVIFQGKGRLSERPSQFPDLL